MSLFSPQTSFIFASAPAEFASTQELNACVQHMRATIPPYSLTASGVVGKVTAHKVRLSVRIPFFGNGFKTYFLGTFHEAAGGTTLSGRFTMHPFAKGFLCFWFGFCLLWTVTALAAVVITHARDWFLPLFGLAMLFFGYGIVRWGQWFARGDARMIAEAIENAMQKG